MSGAKNKTKNPVGRPSQLLETLEKAKKYLYGGWQEVGDVVPSVVGLACYTGKSRSNLYDYCDKNSDFQYILDSINSMQQNLLINRGLDNTFNSNIVKLMLGSHGIHEKQEVTSTNNTIVQVNPKDVKEALKQFNDEY